MCLDEPSMQLNNFIKTNYTDTPNPKNLPQLCCVCLCVIV